MALTACAVEDVPVTGRVALDSAQSGKLLFERETFGGNGRTCATCHDAATGTISPASAQARFAADPGDPLFRGIDSDDGVGDDYVHLLTDATIRVKLALPDNVTLADDPGATHVVMRRGIPSTLNTPALDPVLMLDGRAPSLEAQAAGAVGDHYQASVAITARQAEAIADWQTKRAFFSSQALFRYARSGHEPSLPDGRTTAERRGRAFFEPDGLCGRCHGGPMLNETTAAFPIAAPGSRFASAFVSQLNPAGHPVHTFVFATDDGEVTVTSPDPGRALITGDPADANQFKIPSLWGTPLTAPYFHDNSAHTLDDVVEHYDRFFRIIGVGALSDRDKADIVAYLRLL